MNKVLTVLFMLISLWFVPTISFADNQQTLDDFLSYITDQEGALEDNCDSLNYCLGHDKYSKMLAYIQSVKEHYQDSRAENLTAVQLQAMTEYKGYLQNVSYQLDDFYDNDKPSYQDCSTTTIIPGQRQL